MPVADQGVNLSLNRYPLVPRVLCFVTSGAEVLLLRGAPTKRLWAGKYNGLGGHVERGESVHAAAQREIREEAGLEVSHLRLRGVITIDAGPTAGIGLFVFTARARGRRRTLRASAVARPAGTAASENVACSSSGFHIPRGSRTSSRCSAHGRI